MVSDKTIYKAFRTRPTLSTKPVREIYHFHYLPELYIGFKAVGYGLVNLLNTML